MRRWILIILVAIVAGFGFLRFRRIVLPVPVQFTRVVRGPAIDAVYATGNVEPVVMIPIGPRTAGRLTELLADEGDRVVRGQPLARMEATDLIATVRELEAREKLSRSELDRLSRMQMPGAMSEQQRDNARFNTEAAVAATERARRLAEFLTLSAPADGTVIRRDGEVGQTLNATQTVFWLSGSQELRVSAEIDEEDIPRVELGQSVVLRADAFPNEVFRGTVRAITPKGDPVSRSFRVRIALPPETKLRPGMTTETNIIVSKRENVLLVPASALDGNRVWALDGTHPVSRELQLGIRGDQFAELQGGLDEGAPVILNPPASLSEATVVRPSEVPVAVKDRNRGL